MVALLMIFFVTYMDWLHFQVPDLLCLNPCYGGGSLSCFLQKVMQAQHLQLLLVMSCVTRHHAQQGRTWSCIL